MKISVVGTGYVGLVAAAVFADYGNDVVCVDIDQSKIDGLKQGKIPIFEPGLDSLVQRNTECGRLQFTTSHKEAAEHGEVVFMAVGTPGHGPEGSVDLRALFAAVTDMAVHMTQPTVIVNKSTVPVGTAERVAQIARSKTDAPIVVASNPEFLKEGSAIADFMQPDRVVIGTDDELAKDRLTRLYKPFCRTSDRILYMDVRSAELTKYAANAYLATRISFINDIANLCDHVGADVELVRKGMGSDSRIGPKFLYPGMGYGGSCFPKDTRALIHTAREHGLDLSLVSGAERINERQKLTIVRKLREAFDGQLSGLKVALWGLSFKPNTDDIREAPALHIVRSLMQDGVEFRVSDPEGIPNFLEALGPGAPVEAFADPYGAADGVDALILCTEWRQFRSPDFHRLHSMMRQAYLFDGRNQWDPAHVRGMGFSYFGIGRGRSEGKKEAL